jgi:IS1 family transposase
MASMKKLDPKARAQVLHLLMEGNSVRGTARLTGTSKTTILKLIEDAGRAAAWYQDRVLRNLPCEKLQVDEIWGFTYCKEANRTTAKKSPEASGDTWLWLATCATTKLVPTWYIGPRDGDSAFALMCDLRERLDGRKIQLTTDGLRAYVDAVGGSFGSDRADFAQLQKIYGQSMEGRRGSSERRYSPAVCTGARKVPVFGDPDPKHISTSFAERNNLNIRMHSRRMTRLTNAFSKKLENHAHAMALHFLYYNFVRIHQTLKMSPAMAAGVTKRLWEMSDVVAMLETWETVQAKLNAA